MNLEALRTHVHLEFQTRFGIVEAASGAGRLGQLRAYVQPEIDCEHDVGRIKLNVKHKVLFRELHTQHGDAAFPDDPIDGKKLINTSAIGCSRARSPHLWMLQQEARAAGLKLLRLPRNAAIATSSVLKARKRPEWCNICVVLQILEDHELELMLCALPSGCGCHVMVFDGALVYTSGGTSIGSLLDSVNCGQYVHWAKAPLPHMQH